MPPSPDRKISDIQKKLLRWYEKSRRDLPWRRTSDPYKIWISEVMLQQTRVDTVIPYYERFLETFPTVRALAGAEEETVLKHWEGLGYYTRAHNLHAAAKEVCETYGGKLPRTSAELRMLKGFGPYTSAAVASIAFGEPTAVLDGNVRRVVSRLFRANESFDEIAQSLIASEDPSAFNQGMMELGAMICLPRNPKCATCPLSSECAAFSEGVVALYPPAKEKKPPRTVHAVSAVVFAGDRVFVRHRSGKGRWKGFWEFPTFESPEALPQGRAVSDLEELHGITVQTPQPAGSFKHQLTHQTIQMTVLRAKASQTTGTKNGDWVTAAELKKLPVARLQQRVWELGHPLDM